jgi:positive regulator of sigma E activity
MSNKKEIYEALNEFKKEWEKNKLIHIQMYKDSFTTAIALCFLSALFFVVIGVAGFTFLGGITLSGIMAGILISSFVFLINKQIEQDYQTREDRVNKKLKELGYKNE